MTLNPEHHKVQQYLADAKVAETEAAKNSDPEIKASFANIARAYRQMAQRIAMLTDDDDDTTYTPRSK
jgi:hypothetical protein